MKTYDLTEAELSRVSNNSSGEQRGDSVSGSVSEDSSDDGNIRQDGGSKKRKRPLKISCELCKARKVKCDRAEPSCGWCSRNNRVCIYNERKKPGLRASYGVELEDKLNRIEASLYLLGRRVEEHITTSSCNGGEATPTYMNNQRMSLPPFQQLNETISQSTSIPQSSWAAAPTQTSNHLQFPQLTDDMHGQSMIATTEAIGTPPGVSSQMIMTSSGIEEPRDIELPPRDLLYNLVDLYFKHVGTWSPILDRKTTFDTLFDSKEPLLEPDEALLHAIVVVTLRFSQDVRLTGEIRQRYYNASKQKVQLLALGVPSITIMKALALITVDVLGTSNGPQSWNLLALLARNIVHLGLGTEKSVYLAQSQQSTRSEQHQPYTLPQPNSWIEDEGRRRLFWLTYIMDRYATVATNFDFILNDKETDRSLPCRYDLFSKNEPVETRWFRDSGISMNTSMDSPENLGSFSYHCEVLKILSQIHSFLRTPVDIESATDVNRWRDTYRDLDSKLNTWLSKLPGEYGKISQLCHSDPGSRVSNWIMIHAAFVTSMIRLHSVAAYPTSRSHLFMSSQNAVQRCLAAVESLRAIAQDVIDTSTLDLLGPPFAFSLWVCGRLLLVHAATTEAVVDQSIWFLMSTLETMGQYWEVARNWAGILNRLVREGQQAHEDAQNGRAVASGKTYMEMRRCAHDLAMLTLRKPRTVLDPPATRPISSNEMEYLDVFEWFSYPRTPPATATQYTFVQTPGENGHGGFASMVPALKSDWLDSRQPSDFKPPYE